MHDILSSAVINLTSEYCRDYVFARSSGSARAYRLSALDGALESALITLSERCSPVVSRVLSTAVAYDCEPVFEVAGRYCTPDSDDPDLMRSPLHFAVGCASVSMVSKLLSFGYDPNALDGYGRGVIFNLISDSHKAEIDSIRRHWSSTILGGMLAVYADRVSRISDSDRDAIIRLLYEADCDLNAFDVEGMTVFHRVCAGGQLDLAKSLMEYRIDTEILDLYGRSGLHLAAISNNHRLVSYLVRHGMDFNQEDCSGKTPKDYISCSPQKPHTLSSTLGSRDCESLSFC